MSDELTPITRKETFLAKAGGQNVVTPTPITREETFLQAIIDNGSGGGGGGGGTFIVHQDENNTLDKTWREIVDVAHEGRNIAILNSYKWDDAEGVFTFIFSWAEANDIIDPPYRLGFFEVYPGANESYGHEYGTDTEDGYPVEIDLD